MNKDKNSALALVTGLLFGAHLFLIAPLKIYFANYTEYRSPLSEILPYLFVASLVSSVLIGFLILFLSKKGYVRLVALVLGLGLYLYIQFYFFLWDYGIFDGRAINWDQNTSFGFLEVFVIAFISFASLYFGRRFIPVAFLFLTVLFIGEVFILSEGYRRYNDRVESIPSDPRLGEVNELSGERNVIVLLVDTLQSDVFEEVVNESPELKKQLSGFTYFRNSTGSFPYTRLSVYAVLTGAPYQPGEKLQDYYRRVIEQQVHKMIQKDGGVISHLDPSNNLEYLAGTSQARIHEMASLFDVVLFRQVPHFIKPMIFNQYAFRLAGLVADYRVQRDLAVLSSLSHESYLGSSQLAFKFLHLWGTHLPAVLDEHCEVRDEPSVTREAFKALAHCELRAISVYLQTLRDLGVYDKSLIFLISDHGSRFPLESKDADSNSGDVPDFVMAPAYPTIAVKDFDAMGEFQVSNAPVSLTDIAATILKRVNLGNAQEGRDLYSVGENELRARKFFYFRAANEALRFEKIPFMWEFRISGFTRDRSSWSLEREFVDTEMLEEVTRFIDFGTSESLKNLDLGWSILEKGSTTYSWSISQKASIFARLPDQSSVTLKMRLRSLVEGQKVHVHLNGRPVVTWEVPGDLTFREYRAQLDLSASERSKINRIELRIEKNRPPEGEELRSLGISVDWARFE